MKTIQVYFIYYYDSVRGWVKCSRSVNPENGFEYEEIATVHLIQLVSKYQKGDFTIMSVYKNTAHEA